MDLETIKSIIHPTESNDGKIKYGDTITRDVIEIMEKGSLTNIKKCFAPLPSDCLQGDYIVELTCNKCGKTYIESLSKTKTIDAIRGKYQSICSDCYRDELIAWSKREQETERKTYEEIIHESTNEFIEKYLTVSDDFDDRISKEDYKSLNDIVKNCDIDIIVDKINDMNYKDFLKTKYWKMSSFTKKKKAGFRCELCNGENNLVVHHRTYDNHGYELFNQDDLICLCNDCHERFHKIVKE